MAPPLACTVRGCGEPLERHGRTFGCGRGHVFDIAKRGYVNLLQPQDRKSLTSGDSKSAVEARARLLAAGAGRGVFDVFVDRADGILAAMAGGGRPASVVIDLGSGAGDVLGELAGRRAIAGVGIDLSVAAAEYASRRFPSITWVVANADRRLPLRSGTVDLVLSAHARRNPAECARVLSPGGTLLVAVPAEDDLIELREALHGTAVAYDRGEALVAEHQAAFTLHDRSTARERRPLDRDALLDVLRATYRGARRSAAAQADALTSIDVTFASELFLFRRRERTD